MLTDMGSHFSSELMAETSRLFSFRQLTTTPYNTLCNGMVKRFNRTLKKMVRRLCAERHKDYDRNLSSVLFAFRDTSQELNSRIFNFWIGLGSHCQRSIADFSWAMDKRGIGSWNQNNLACFRFKRSSSVDISTRHKESGEISNLL